MVAYGSVKPSGWLANMTPRERMLLSLLALTAFIMTTAVLFYLRSYRLRDRTQRITDTRLAIDKLQTRGAAFQVKLEDKKQREASISSQALLFSTLLEDAMSVAEIETIPKQEELPPTDLGQGLSKRSFEFELRSVSLDQLTRFLAAVESKPGHIVLVQQLKTYSLSSTEDRLNVDITLSTWEREKTESDQTGLFGLLQ